MKKLNGKEIFLGMIGILTLVVLIIGATFAYFSASVTSDKDITGQSYEFDMSLTVTRVDPATAPAKGDKLIPLTESDIGAAVNAGCVDKNNYTVCQIYQLSFRNGSSEAVTLSGNLTASQNDFSNLYYNVTTIGGAKSTLAAGTPISGLTPVTTGLTNLVINPGDSTMYLMVYIKNDPANNQPDDQAKNFIGTLTFTDVTSSSGKIQATFSIGG